MLETFDWDTRQDAGLADWVQVLVDAAAAEESAADVRDYLPGAETWKRLGFYGTRQWLDVESVTVPAASATALEQAAEGQIPRGAAALTVVGTRHRAGTWDTDEMRTERQVSFTVFVACPGEQSCTLLRLWRRMCGSICPAPRCGSDSRRMARGNGLTWSR